MHRQKLFFLTQNLKRMKKYKIPEYLSQKISSQKNTNNKSHPQSKNLNLNPKYHKYILIDYTFLQDYIVVQSINTNQFIAKIVNTDQYVLFTKTPIFNKQGEDSKRAEKILERFQILMQLFEQGIVLADNMFLLEEETGKMYIYVIEAYLEKNQSKEVEKNCLNFHKNDKINAHENYGSQKKEIRDFKEIRQISQPQQSQISDKFSIQGSKNSKKDNHINHHINNQTSQSYISQPIKYFTLTQYIQLTNNTNHNDELLSAQILKHRRNLLDKIKILLDYLHQRGQPYLGLTADRIILDDQGNIFLAPFSLDIYDENKISGKCQNYTMKQSIKKNIWMTILSNYTRAYYSPELLSTGQQQIKYTELIKNDIWAFGCITMQLFFYSSPIFYSPTASLQLKNINQFFNLQARQPSITSQTKYFNEEYLLNQFITTYSVINEELLKLEPLINIILNALEPNSEDRVLCTERVSYGNSTYRELRNKNNISNSAINQMTKTINRNSYSRSKSKGKQRKDNFNKGQQNSSIRVIRDQLANNFLPTQRNNKVISQQIKPKNCQLTIKVICISHINIRKQLRINIYLDKQYSMFVSAHRQAKVYGINKVIRVESDDYAPLYQILSQPILIEIREDQKCEKIWANLSTLVMVDNDGKKRLWEKPLVGSYGTKKKDDNYIDDDKKAKKFENFKDCKIKLYSELKTPQKLIMKQQISEIGKDFMQKLEKYKFQKEQIEKKLAQEKQNNNTQNNTNTKKQENDNDNPLTEKKINEEANAKKEKGDKKAPNHLQKIYNNLLQINKKWGFKNATQKNKIKAEKKQNEQEKLSISPQIIE